jgi:peptidoglycan/LPS O-acetylase OafA/YrhL
MSSIVLATSRLDTVDAKVGVAHGYRADIDGLRAVAIVAVILFHAGVPGFGAGFFGVDIFFVISGFLITTIISREVAAGTFSFLHFYERRVRRIFPALFVMLGCCIVPAYFMLPPDEIVLFARSMLGAALFSSNFFFWSQTGYFDAPAETHALLHTWSLAIEEQFYLVFPILFIVIAKRFSSNLIFVLAVLTGISVLANGFLSAWSPTVAFYFSPARAWELLFGSIVALGAFSPPRSRILREGMSLFGLVLISCSFVLSWGGGLRLQ